MVVTPVVGLVAVPLVGFVCSAVHELAHAVICLLLGGSVISIEVGSGPVLYATRVGGVDCYLGSLPGGGLVQVDWSARERVLFRHCLVLLAGPIASTAIAALALSWWALSWWNRNSGWQAWGAIQIGLVAMVVGLCASMQACLSWLPIRFESRGRSFISDMAQLFGVLRLSKAQRAKVTMEWRCLAMRQRAWGQFRSGDAAAAISAWSASSAWPWLRSLDLALFVWAIQGAEAGLAQLEVGERELAAWCSAHPELVADKSGQAEAWSKVVTLNRAFLLLASGRVDRIPAALAATTQAFRRHPDDVDILRTHGFAMLHAGEVRRGLRLLQKAWRRVEPIWLRGLCALYLAFGLALQQRPRRAQRFLHKARALFPHNPMLPEYERRIAGLLASPATLAQ